MHRLAPLLVVAAAVAFSSCATPAKDETPAKNAEEGELAAEIALPDQGHHWPAEKPVGTSAGPVSAEMLAARPVIRSRWLHYGGDYRNFRHSPLEDAQPRKRQASCRWRGRSRRGTLGQFEVSPVVYGGVMYVTSSYNRLFALDAKTGELLWRYDHPNPKNLRLCCGPPNRGVGIGGDRADGDARCAPDRVRPQDRRDRLEHRARDYKDGYQRRPRRRWWSASSRSSASRAASTACAASSTRTT